MGDAAEENADVLAEFVRDFRGFLATHRPKFCTLFECCSARVSRICFTQNFQIFLSKTVLYHSFLGVLGWSSPKTFCQTQLALAIRGPPAEIAATALDNNLNFDVVFQICWLVYGFFVVFGFLCGLLEADQSPRFPRQSRKLSWCFILSLFRAERKARTITSTAKNSSSIFSIQWRLFVFSIFWGVLCCVFPIHFHTAPPNL